MNVFDTFISICKTVEFEDLSALAQVNKQFSEWFREDKLWSNLYKEYFWNKIRFYEDDRRNFILAYKMLHPKKFTVLCGGHEFYGSKLNPLLIINTTDRESLSNKLIEIYNSELNPEFNKFVNETVLNLSDDKFKFCDHISDITRNDVKTNNSHGIVDHDGQVTYKLYDLNTDTMKQVLVGDDDDDFNDNVIHLYKVPVYSYPTDDNPIDDNPIDDNPVVTIGCFLGGSKYMGGKYYGCFPGAPGDDSVIDMLGFLFNEDSKFCPVLQVHFGDKWLKSDVDNDDIKEVLGKTVKTKPKRSSCEEHVFKIVEIPFVQV